MIAQCPTCSTKMRLKRPDSWRVGQRVKVTCRCGQVLMFAVPQEIRQAAESATETLDKLGEALERMQKISRRA